jgi:Bacterial regulatory protein, Fis family
MGKLRFDDVVFACQACCGNITRASERLGVTRRALHLYLRRTPQARELFAEWRERMLDEAETALWDCVRDHQP